MALVPVTIFSQFTSSEALFLAALADHSYIDGQLIIGNGSTGGVSISTLTQGAGVTITNGHGTITIAAAGGGLSQLTTASTVNGTNTTFVFASASAQPSYVVSDGVWLTILDNNSNPQWAWTSGTKTVTMTVPPTGSIFAVV